MTHKLFCTLTLIALALVGFAANPAGAATTAAGPYYANPSWDQTLPSSTRFIVLSNMNSAAVLDRETGLVWEQSPSTVTFPWLSAQFHCNTLGTGGRLGWRLPTFQELASLVDPSVPSPGPTLPSGHPFGTVESSVYWSASTLAFNSALAWVVDFSGAGFVSDDKSGSDFAWCVRGGQGVELSDSVIRVI
jgi:hypothetical protein